MSASSRQNFTRLGRAIRSGKAALLEYRHIESDQTMVIICTVKHLATGRIEYTPVARLFDKVIAPLVLPGPQEPAVRADLN